MRRPSVLEKHSTADTQRLPNHRSVESALDSTSTNEHGTEDEALPDDPPEGGYGWVVCGAVSLINGFTWGVAAVSVTLGPYMFSG